MIPAPGVYDGEAEERPMSRSRIDQLQSPAVPAPESTPTRPEPRAGEAHGLALIVAVEARLAQTSAASAPVAREFHLSASPKDARIGTRGPSQEVDP